MLGQPRDGWSRLHLFDIDIEVDCFFGDDNPFNWLKACKFGLEKQLPATLLFDSEELGQTIVIADGSRTTIFIDDAYKGMSMRIYEHYNIRNLAEAIIMDINRDFNSWKECIGYFGHPKYSSREDIEFQSKMLMQGQYFRELERVEMRLKTALRETESALLKRNWK